jgi:ABC-type spermidine/putrescine transport system permease subunit II
MELKRPRRGPVRAWRIGLHGFCAFVFLFLMAPLIVVFPISFSSSPAIDRSR